MIAPAPSLLALTMRTAASSNNRRSTWNTKSICLSDDELNAVIGGAINDLSNYQKWANDPDPAKLQWNPAYPPGRGSAPPPLPRPHIS
jgi:hypothetical protein